MSPLSPDDDCPTGIQMGAAATQTDVKRRYPDGNIEQAIVTWNASSATTYRPSCGSPSGAAFGTPTKPANTTVVITQRRNPALLVAGHFTLAQSGPHDNAARRHYRLACDDGASHVSFPTAQPRSTLSNTALTATSKIVVAWTVADMPSTNCSRIRVYRGTSRRNEEQICDVPRTAGGCDDTGQAASGAYARSTASDPGIVYTYTLPEWSIGTGCQVNGVEAVGQTTTSAGRCTDGATIRKGDTVSFAGSSQQYLGTVALAAGTFQVYPALIDQAADNVAVTVHEWLSGQHVRELRLLDDRR